MPGKEVDRQLTDVVYKQTDDAAERDMDTRVWANSFFGC